MFDSLSLIKQFSSDDQQLNNDSQKPCNSLILPNKSQILEHKLIAKIYTLSINHFHWLIQVNQLKAVECHEYST